MSDSNKCFGEKWSRKRKLGGAGGGMQEAELCKCPSWASCVAFLRKGLDLRL